jgi:hypothetical protein
MLIGTGFMAFNNIAGVAKDAKHKGAAFGQLIPLGMCIRSTL